MTAVDVGVVGLGAMGRPIAEHLVAGGTRCSRMRSGRCTMSNFVYR
jgi:3-hydroxyisobutyrate dehydrogenase-like beta-hydroxyacid dehydrogenase